MCLLRKNTIWRWILLLSLGLPAVALPSLGDFERYQLILDRKPFGVLVEEAPAMAGSVIPPFVQHWRLSAMVANAEGSKAGLVDKRSNQSFLLAIGEKTDDGVELVETRPEDGSVVLTWQGQTFVLDLDGDTETAASAQPSEPLPPGPRVVVPGRAPPGPAGATDQRKAMEDRKRELFERMTREREGARLARDERRLKGVQALTPAERKQIPVEAPPDVLPSEDAGPGL